MEQNKSEIETQNSTQTQTTPTNTQKSAEGEVRQLLEEFADAVRSGKIEDIMSFYDPSLVAFDVAPPLRFTNADDYRKNWETLFTSAMKFPVTYEWSEEKLMVNDDIGVFHCLVHTAGTMINPPEGQNEKMDCWGRYTCCVKKMNNRWRIVHEHFSVPVNEEGKALMDLKPVGVSH